MSIELKDLGISNEDLTNRVVEQIAEKMLFGLTDTDEDGNVLETSTRFQDQMKTRVAEKIDQSIEEIAGRNVIPEMSNIIENYCLQETNNWGEKRGEPVSFTEYLIARAEAYLSEMVDHTGKPKGRDSYSWQPKTTRVVFLIEKHLHYSISQAMEGALRQANSTIAGGIEAAVKKSVRDIQDKLKVTVKV